MQSIFRALQKFNWGPLVVIQKLLFSSCCSSCSVVIVVSSLFPCGVRARKKTGRFKDVNTKDVKRCVSGISLLRRNHQTTAAWYHWPAAQSFWRVSRFMLQWFSTFSTQWCKRVKNDQKTLTKWSTRPLSGNVMIIGDFWQPFCVGKNGGRKARPRKTTIARAKRRLLDSAWAAKLLARLTELAWSDVRDTCASGRHFLLAQKKRKKSLNIVTLPLQIIRIFGIG